MTKWPLIENWRSVIDKGEGLTHEQAQQMLKDMQWAAEKADEANAYAARLGGGMGDIHNQMASGTKLYRDPATLGYRKS